MRPKKKLPKKPKNDLLLSLKWDLTDSIFILMIVSEEVQATGVVMMPTSKNFATFMRCSGEICRSNVSQG